MNKTQTFEQFLISADALSFSYLSFSINMIIAITISIMIKYTYIKCGTSVSNRKSLAINFPILVITTVFIITIVKSSLALSLGLVGALSIVRFRTAIKEPAELMYLFFCIAVGLGLGADQRVITITATLIILGYVWVKYYFEDDNNSPNNIMILNIKWGRDKIIELDDIVILVKKHTKFVSLVRLEETDNKIDVYLEVEFDGFENINKFRKIISEMDHNINISIIDNSGLV
jgi:hypothetical protein